MSNHSKHSNITESLAENDLKWLVDNDVMIDMHKTKLGRDADHIVLAISIDDKKPANDLAFFIEHSVYDFEDVEVSAATDTNGKYLVYVEVARTPEAYNIIKGILQDSAKLTGIEQWNFKTMKMADSVEFNRDNFDSFIVTDPQEYLELHPEQPEQSKEEQVKESIKSRYKFLLNY